MLKTIFLVACLAAVIHAQVVFEEDNPAPAPVPKSKKVLNTRLGILASFLNLDPVPGANTIGAEPGPDAKNPVENPHVPIGQTQPTGPQTCLCVPAGKCLAPPVPPPPQPAPVPLPPKPVEPVPPPTNFGEGLIDIRIVNRPPPGVRCSDPTFQYCCANNAFPPAPPPPAKLVGTCGTAKPIPTPEYALNPAQAKFGEFPWMVVILGPTNNYVGGGVLVTPKHVLTAAHKIYNIREGFVIKVRLGEWDAKANVEPFKYFETRVVSVKINPFFNRANLHNDVAILTLEEPVDLKLTPHINPVCMAPLEREFVGRQCWVTGWGKDAFGPPGNFQYILKKVDVPVLDSNFCEDRLRTTRLGPFFQLSRSSFVCAGGVPGKDACTGDGGSPLVCEVDGRAELVGLVAWGIGCADPGIPAVYVNVRSYADWINAELVD